MEMNTHRISPPKKAEKNLKIKRLETKRMRTTSKNEARRVQVEDIFGTMLFILELSSDVSEEYVCLLCNR